MQRYNVEMEDDDNLDYLSDEAESAVPTGRMAEYAKREQALLQKNAQINKQTEQLVLETDQLVKHTEEKLNEPIVITKVVTKKPQVLVQDVPEDEVDKMAQDMGAEAGMKFYKARLKLVEKDLKDLVQEIRQKEKKFAHLEKQSKEHAQENTKVKKQFLQLQSKADRHKKEMDDAQEKIKQLQSQLDTLRKEKTISNTNTTTTTTSAIPVTKKTPDSARLQKTLDDMEKYKQQIADLKRQRKEDEEQHKAEVSKLRNDVKLLDRQKQDLITAFKKQAKLVDILKRQKLHVEAARLVCFSEDEFQSLLDLGSA